MPGLDAGIAGELRLFPGGAVEKGFVGAGQRGVETDLAEPVPGALQRIVDLHLQLDIQGEADALKHDAQSGQGFRLGVDPELKVAETAYPGRGPGSV